VAVQEACASTISTSSSSRRSPSGHRTGSRRDLIHRVESLGLPVTAVVARRVKGRIDDPEMRRRPEHLLNRSVTNGSLPLRSTEQQRPSRERQAAESPGRCGSRRESGNRPRATGRAERRSPSKEQSGVSPGTRSRGHSAALPGSRGTK
jgi:hypothetical protein